MKRIFAFLLMISVLIAVFAGCSPKTEEIPQPTKTETSSSSLETSSSAAENAASDSSSTPSGPDVTFSEAFTQDEDELEILTFPIDDPDTPTEVEITEGAPGGNLTEEEAVTEPTLPAYSGEKIELPFVPAS